MILNPFETFNQAQKLWKQCAGPKKKEGKDLWGFPYQFKINKIGIS